MSDTYACPKCGLRHSLTAMLGTSNAAYYWRACPSGHATETVVVAARVKVPPLVRHRRIALKLAEGRARRAAKRRHWGRVLALGCAELRREHGAMLDQLDAVMYARAGVGPYREDSDFGWCAGGGLAS